MQEKLPVASFMYTKAYKRNCWQQVLCIIVEHRWNSI